LSYCLIGSNGLVSIWDVDEIKLHSDCTSDLTGGTLTTADGSLSAEVCVDDGVDDLLEVNLTGAQGPNMAWIVTDLNGVILQLPSGPTFNFEGTAESECLLWSISYINGLSGLDIAMNAYDLEGCFALSNPLTVIRKRGEDCAECEVMGGAIVFNDGSTNITICTDDNEDNIIGFEVSGNTGDASVYVITDTDANILEILSSNTYNFEGLPMQEYLVWHLSYTGLLQNAAVGNNASQLAGCFELSNPISVNAETVSGGGCASIQNPSDESFIIAPNPVDDLLLITTELEPHIDGSIKIYNHLGQLLIHQEMIHRKKEIPTAALAQGSYYIHIDYKNLRIIKPFIKI
ncbi:MAG: T9SS type A sorting domain-containing protein, partial [Saprospiraceae bacterium]|nr:T9SS type A sorting domain-containing protein [Saprospiraceae bacterium]